MKKHEARLARRASQATKEDYSGHVTEGVGGFDRPADRALLALRLLRTEQVYRGDPHDPHRFYAWCPVCKTEGAFTLTITEHGEGGPISFWCDLGCDQERIDLALRLCPSCPARTGLW